MVRWIVDAAHAGMRLDRFVTAMAPQGAVTNSLLQRLIRRKQAIGVTDAGGAPVVARAGGHRLNVGDAVSLADDVLAVRAADVTRESAAPPAPLTAADRAFVRSLVLYRDADVIAVNKPAGLASQGGVQLRTHLDGLLAGLVDEDDGAAERPRLVHRLDKDTSGVLLLGATRQAAARLSEMFRTPGRVRKEYLAFLVTSPRSASGTIDQPLVQATLGDMQYEQTAVSDDPRFTLDPRLGIDRAPLPRVLSAVTHYQVLHDLKQNGAVVQLVPETGRKHQLRVHCASVLGAAILGDSKYGQREVPEGLRALLGAARRPLHLHMRRVVLQDWAGQGRDLVVEAPLPEHIVDTLNRLGIALH